MSEVYRPSPDELKQEFRDKLAGDIRGMRQERDQYRQDAESLRQQVEPEEESPLSTVVNIMLGSIFSEYSTDKILSQADALDEHADELHRDTRNMITKSAVTPVQFDLSRSRRPGLPHYYISRREEMDDNLYQVLSKALANYQPSNAEVNELEIEQPTDLTEEKARTLLFLSFYFSQGKEDLQERIFHWLHSAYPSYKIPEEMEQSVYESTVKTIRRFAPEPLETETSESSGDNPQKPSNHPILTTSQIENDTSAILGHMANYFNNYPPGPLETRTSELVEGMNSIIDRDYHFLIEEDGRPRKENENSQSLMSDRYLSHICKYGFEGHTTGLSEYDTMFKMASNFLLPPPIRHQSNLVLSY
jgi:hypothetical protein